MAINEQIITGRKWRRLIDKVTDLWQRISYWTHSTDVEFNDNKTAETKVGAIDGITDSLASTSSRIAASAKSVKQLNDNLQFPDGTGFYPDVQNGERGYNTDPARGADTFRPFSKGLDKMPVYTKAMQAYSPPTNSGAPQSYPLWTIDISKYKKCRVEMAAGPNTGNAYASLLFNGQSIAVGGSYQYNYFNTIDLGPYKSTNNLSVVLTCTDPTQRNNSLYAAVSLIFN